MDYGTVNLSKVFNECLPTELSQYFESKVEEYEDNQGIMSMLDKKTLAVCEFETEDQHGPNQCIMLGGKTWDVLADVAEDGSSFFTRAISEYGKLYIWNCMKHSSEEDRILVKCFKENQAMQYTIPYSQKGELYARFFLEGKGFITAEEPPKIAEKVAKVARSWIQEQGLQAHCSNLIGREFLVPIVEPPLHADKESVSAETPPLLKETSMLNYINIFIKCVLAIGAIYLVCSATSRYFGRTNTAPFPKVRASLS